MDTRHRRRGIPLAQFLAKPHRLLLLLVVMLLYCVLYSLSSRLASWGVDSRTKYRDRATDLKYSQPCPSDSYYNKKVPLSPEVCGHAPADFSQIHLDNFCGKWQTQYIARHKLQRQQLIEVVEKGLQNGVTGVPLADWRERLADNAFPDILIFVCNRESDVVLLDFFGRASIPSVEDLNTQTAGAKIVVMRQNKGYVVPWLLADAGLRAALGVGVPQAWGCLNRFLLWPNPLPTALDFVPLASQLESKDAFSICVHVRLKDEEIHADGSLYKDSEHKSLVDAIMASVKILEQYWRTEACSSTTVVFFSSSNHLKEIAAARYDNVLTTPVRPIHTGLSNVSRLSDVQMTAGEWNLLSKCKMYLLTQSGFSATAVARGLSLDKIFTISLGEKLIPWRPVPLLDLATSWSGL